MRIGELSQHSGLSQHTIRYYEKIGLLPRAARDPSGRRVYDDETLRWIDFLSRLKATRMPLADIKTYALWREIGETTIDQRQRLLIDHRSHIENEIAELQSNLERLDTKITLYEDMKNEHNERNQGNPP